jgi:uncharacterized protein involved in exopolysaccharide biosynthesis
VRDSFDAFEFLDYLRQRWLVVASAAGVALLGTLAASLILPKRYTATVAILIEPPGSNDIRTATAISPVYLESLRSYEAIAAGDRLFAQAVQQFRLQDAEGRPPIERLKRRVLKVSKPRDTRVLQIAVTLQDAKTAHAMAGYLAEQTVAFSRAANAAIDAASTENARRELTAARSRLELARQAAAAHAKLESADVLSSEVRSLVDLQADIQARLLAVETEGGEEQKTAAARAAALRKNAVEVSRKLAEKSALYSRRMASQREVDSDLNAAESAFEAASARVRDLEAAAGNRTESLRIIDPGIVPQSPSSPNVPLNLVIAVFLACASSLVYLSVRFSMRQRDAKPFRAPLQRGGISA